VGNERELILQELAFRITTLQANHPVRVAIDGRTASGKTTFGDELAAMVARTGRPVIRTSIDGFHRPKAERYARGRHSPEGYYYDARDLGAVRTLLLDPLGPDGDRHYRTASFNLEKDLPVNEPSITAAPNAVLILDGTFLQRAELAEGWDATIFLKISEAVSERRGIARDANLLGGVEAALELYAKRYSPAERIYEAAVQPELTADVVVENEDFDRPVLRFKRCGRLTGN
jgi:uridine kinase